MKARRYQVIVRVTDPRMVTYGQVIPMTLACNLLTHREACIVLSKLTHYPWRQETLREVGDES